MAAQLAKKEVKKQSVNALVAKCGASRLPLVKAADVSRGGARALDPTDFAAPGLHDIAGEAYPDFATALGFALAAAFAATDDSRKPVFFCEQIISQRDQGSLYGPGLLQIGITPERLVIASVKTEQDLLWCAEEALSSGGVGAVVLRLSPLEKKYAFTQSRRLHLRALEAGLPAFVARGAPERGAIAAETTWRVSARPGKPVDGFAARAASKRILDDARWEARLERARTAAPGSYLLGWSGEKQNRKTIRLHMDVPLADGLAVASASQIHTRRRA